MAAQKHFSQDNNTKKKENTQLGITKYTRTHTHFSLTDKQPKERKQAICKTRSNILESEAITDEQNEPGSYKL